MNNRLSGRLPSELTKLTNLTNLILARNQLSGCVPADLRFVKHNDLARLGLPYCEPP